MLLAGLGLSLLLDRALQQMLSPALNWLLQISSVSLPAFFVLSTLGYVVSFATGRPRYGDAYDCVHYYYTLFDSLGTIAAGILLWPPNPIAPAIALSLAIGCAGAIWLGFGFVSITRRLEVWQRRQKRRRVNTADA